jgi:hypothetical protein
MFENVGRQVPLFSSFDTKKHTAIHCFPESDLQTEIGFRIEHGHVIREREKIIIKMLCATLHLVYNGISRRLIAKSLRPRGRQLLL